jgi:hypothetical protein
MTIRKGQEWGRVGALPPDTHRARTDAELHAVVNTARRAGSTPPPVALLGGSLMRAVGGTGDESRLTGDVAILPVDLVRVEIDGRSLWAAAHVVAHRSWWRGRVVAAMNGQFIDRFDVTPRAHPNDGRVDVLTVDETMTLRDRWRARGRLPSGTHVPHPAITVRQVSSIELSFDAPMRIVVDGVPAGESRTLRLEVEPDALTVCV